MSLKIYQEKTLNSLDINKLNDFIKNINSVYNIYLPPKNVLYNGKANLISENYNIYYIEPEKIKKEVSIIKPIQIQEDNDIQIYKEDIDTENVNIEDMIKDFPLYKPKTLDINKQTFYHLDDGEVLKDIKKDIIGDLNKIKANENDNFCFRGTKSDFEILNHQKIVQRYLNTYTPYRGLLLYHGLGSGKTCSSISILEGMKEQNKIFIMTPASLQQNYKTQLTFCGDKIFKLNNYWYFYKVKENDKENSIKKIISVIKGYLFLKIYDKNKIIQLIEKNKGFWFIKEEEPNYNSLNSGKKIQITEQIKVLMSIKYNFINYNGLTLERYIKRFKKDDINPFNNSTVVIDEIHNLVSRIINILNTSDKDKNSSSKMIYYDLMKAENCKIVALTGTPYINHPCEIGVLMNIIIGYVVVFEYELKQNYNSKVLTEYLNELDTIDIIEYNPSKRYLYITRNPYFFKTLDKKIHYDKSISNLTNSKYKDKINSILQSNGVTFKEPTINYYKPLPDIKEEFEKKFITFNGEKIINNKELLQYKLIGRVSFFGDKKSLMPSLVKTPDGEDIHLQVCKMSGYQLSVYKDILKNNKVSNKDSSYKIFTRAACNFTFLNDDERPKPNAKEYTEELIDLKEGYYKNVTNVSEKDEDYDNDYKTLLLRFMDKFKNINNKIKYFHNDITNYINVEFKKDKDNELKKFSNKYYNILKNIVTSDGCQLLYSNFRMVEGIGLMRELLKYQGFFELVIKKEGKSFNIELVGDYNNEKYKLDPLGYIQKNVFALYTGSEDEEVKEIIRNLYNSNNDKLPPEIIGKLKVIYKNVNIYDNKYGNVIKLLMITSSGAEGIDLKNTKTVHITEPYWHNVRIEQVIGRARRICSHALLNESERTVKVYLYISSIDSENVKEITADETLYNIMKSKKKLSDSFLNLLKEVSIDCNHNCYTLPKGNKIRTIEKSIDEIVNIKKIKKTIS
tara:strand:- start:2127 stop:5012 length:2886 start_codon:yes stop_codon:yes gene_type:complete